MWKKRILICCSTVVAIIVIIVIVCNVAVFLNARGRIYDKASDVPYNHVALLLATSPITPQGGHNYYFDNRITAAYDLFASGKVDYIIASGGDYIDVHANGCDEPKAILDSLVARGVPSKRVIPDYEGTRTLNSIVKAKQVYQLDSVTIISQPEHNARAIALADHYGLYAIAYSAAPSHIRRSRIKNTIREYLARVKMYLDFAIGREAKIKNEIMPITFDSDTSDVSTIELESEVTR
jgi:SanA protein